MFYTHTQTHTESCCWFAFAAIAFLRVGCEGWALSSGLQAVTTEWFKQHVRYLCLTLHFHTSNSQV